MANKQIQKAGEGAQQLQADSMIVNVGIDEKRAREIYQEMNLQLRKEYSKEAFEIATSRVSEFENRLMPKMDAVDGALEAFADPSFQLLLVEAQKTAASTERPADYDLLAELLIHRFQKGENRVTRAGIIRAVEIVDKISDEALLGLTVFHSVTFFFPASGDILQGLETLDNLFGKIIYGELPVGNEWLDHLDILDAVRINAIGNLKTIEQYYPNMLVGYTEVGIEKESENYNQALDILKSNGLPKNILVNHYLNPDFVRLNLPSKEQIDSLTLNQQIVQNGKVSTLTIPINENQKKALKLIYDLYKQDVSLKQNNIKQLMVEWDKFPNLKKLREWWDKLSSSIQITSVGKVLAHSNAQRCDKNLPPLN
ncbi:hypothetical protein FKX85_14885 [Echinicola soli]|uniref:Uncharacterized protein n=1 Tax=Echinicola soli TaxID=2591634 RepID=A0A514CKB1_9BACT|nr:LPO_1073/Vpar_1526 family protein [Echinicola soli]QDH80253.1 hypothetical protein FKX85_14885 [Echinicola soli]